MSNSNIYRHHSIDDHPQPIQGIEAEALHPISDNSLINTLIKSLKNAETNNVRLQEMYDREKEGWMNKNEKFKKQISEMEIFLADYGMEWVGYRFDDEIESKKEKECTPNVRLIVHQIQELNSLVNYLHISQDPRSGIHHFCTHAPRISLVFYCNGMLLKNGPLRPYSWQESKQFMQDIMDGYFPTELQVEYPSGVVFNVSDESTTFCEPNIIIDMHMHNTGKQLLAKLPQKIIRDGLIIDIRNKYESTAKKNKKGERVEIKENVMKNIDSNYVMIDTPMAQLLHSQECLLSKRYGNKSMDMLSISVCTLKVRSSVHNFTLVMKMNANDTLSMVYELVAQYLIKMEMKYGLKDEVGDLSSSAEPMSYNFELFSAIPKKIFDSKLFAKTLRDLKLYPNITLFFRHK